VGEHQVNEQMEESLEQRIPAKHGSTLNKIPKLD